MAHVAFLIGLDIDGDAALSVNAPDVPNGLTLAPIGTATVSEQWQIQRVGNLDFYRLQSVANGLYVQVLGGSGTDQVLQAPPVNTGFGVVSEQWFIRAVNSPISPEGGSFEIVSWILQKGLAFGSAVGDGKTVNMTTVPCLQDPLPPAPIENSTLSAYWRFRPLYGPYPVPDIAVSAVPGDLFGDVGTLYNVTVTNMTDVYPKPYQCALVGLNPTDSTTPTFMYPGSAAGELTFSYLASTGSLGPINTPVAIILEDAEQVVLGIAYSTVLA